MAKKKTWEINPIPVNSHDQSENTAAIKTHLQGILIVIWVKV